MAKAEKNLTWQEVDEAASVTGEIKTAYDAYKAAQKVAGDKVGSLKRHSSRRPERKRSSTTPRRFDLATASASWRSRWTQRTSRRQHRFSRCDAIKRQRQDSN